MCVCVCNVTNNNLIQKSYAIVCFLTSHKRMKCMDGMVDGVSMCTCVYYMSFSYYNGIMKAIVISRVWNKTIHYGFSLSETMAPLL